MLGDGQESEHANWIQLLSVNWGLTRPVSNPAGSTAGRVLSAPRLAELTVTKDEDVATIPLIQEALVGTPRDVKIDFVRTGTGQQDVYYSISLKEALIIAFTQSSAGDRPVESLTLNFTQIAFEGSQMDAVGTVTSPSSYGWNVNSNAPA